MSSEFGPDPESAFPLDPRTEMRAALVETTRLLAFQPIKFEARMQINDALKAQLERLKQAREGLRAQNIDPDKFEQKLREDLQLDGEDNDTGVEAEFDLGPEESP